MPLPKELSLECHTGNCGIQYASYTPENVRIIVIVKSKATSRSVPMKLETLDVSVTSRVNGTTLSMESKEVDSKSGEAKFYFKAALSDYYEVVVLVHSVGNRTFAAQEKREIQAVPEQLTSGEVNLDYPVRFIIEKMKNMKKIEFLDKKFGPFSGESGCGFAMFDGAAVISTVNGVSSPNPQSDPLLVGKKEEDNYVGSDSQRFHIRVTDLGPQKVKTIQGKRCVEIDWWTEFPTGPIVDNNLKAKTITLEEDPNNPGMFISKGLVVVSSKTDLTLKPPHCGFDGLYPSGKEQRKHGESDFRLRLGDLFGNVIASYPSGNSIKDKETVFVKAPIMPKMMQKNLSLNIFILNNPTTGKPVVDPNKFFGKMIKKAEEIYAPLGIFLSTSTHSVAESKIKNRVSSFNKIRGGHKNKSHVYIIPPVSRNGKAFNPMAITSTEILELASQFPEENQTIRVFVVGGLVGKKGKTLNGVAHPPVDFGKNVKTGSAFFGSSPDIVLAHEVGHILTNKSACFGRVGVLGPPLVLNAGGGHFQMPPEPKSRFVTFYNLMGGSRTRLWNVDVNENAHIIGNNSFEPCPKGDKNHPTKKVFNQYRDIRISTYLK
jgi:hypothetical protein